VIASATFRFDVQKLKCHRKGEARLSTVSLTITHSWLVWVKLYAITPFSKVGWVCHGTPE